MSQRGGFGPPPPLRSRSNGPPPARNGASQQQPPPRGVRRPSPQSRAGALMPPSQRSRSMQQQQHQPSSSFGPDDEVCEMLDNIVRLTTNVSRKVRSSTPGRANTPVAGHHQQGSGGEAAALRQEEIKRIVGRVESHFTGKINGLQEENNRLQQQVRALEERLRQQQQQSNSNNSHNGNSAVRQQHQHQQQGDRSQPSSPTSAQIIPRDDVDPMLNFSKDELRNELQREKRNRLYLEEQMHRLAEEHARAMHNMEERVRNSVRGTPRSSRYYSAAQREDVTTPRGDSAGGNGRLSEVAPPPLAAFQPSFPSQDNTSSSRRPQQEQQRESQPAARPSTGAPTYVPRLVGLGNTSVGSASSTAAPTRVPSEARPSSSSVAKPTEQPSVASQQRAVAQGSANTKLIAGTDVRRTPPKETETDEEEKQRKSALKAQQQQKLPTVSGSTQVSDFLETISKELDEIATFEAARNVQLRSLI